MCHFYAYTQTFLNAWVPGVATKKDKKCAELFKWDIQHMLLFMTHNNFLVIFMKETENDKIIIFVEKWESA